MKRQTFTLTLLIGIFCFISQSISGQISEGGHPIRELKTDRILGPGGGGRIVSLAINPKDPKNLFASSDMSSCYVSLDGGASWAQPYRFRNVAEWIFGADGNTVYAVTIWHTYVSKDKGLTWAPLWPGMVEFNRKASDGYLNTDWADASSCRHPIRTLLEDPDDPNIIYILTVNGWMMRSTDGGASFSYISNTTLIFNNRSSGSDARFARLAIDPTTTLANRKLVVLALSGVHTFDVRSGAWTTRNSFTELTSVSGTLPANAVVNAGQIVLDGRNTLLYLKRVSSLSNFETELVISSDFGTTWKVISTNIQNAFSPAPIGANAIKINNFTVVNKDVMYLTAYVSGTERVLKTTNGGNTWALLLTSGPSQSLIANSGWNESRFGTSKTQLNSANDLLGQTYNSMATTPANPNICLTGTLGSVLATFNGGTSWEQLCNNLASPQPALPIDAPAGTANYNGAYRFYKTRGMDQTIAFSYQVDPFNPNHQFICYTDIGLWETYDDGVSWRLADQGTTIGNNNMNNCYDLTFDPNQQNRVYSVWGGGNNNMNVPAGQIRFYNAYNNPASMYGGAYFSTNGGYTWTPAIGIPATGVQGMGITVDPVGDIKSVVYTAIAGYNDVGGIYCSSNGGESYVRFMKGVAARDVMPYSFEWNADASRLYVTFMPIPHTTAFAKANSGYGYNSNTAGAYYLERGSDTWKPVTLPSGIVYAVNQFKCDPVNPDVIYMAARRRGSVSDPDQNPSNGGIYVSKDAGISWKLITASNINTTAVTINSFNPDRIYFSESSTYFNGGMIYYSDKGADTQVNDWLPINFDLPFTAFNNVQQDPQDSNAIYIASHGASMWHLVVEKTAIDIELTPPEIDDNKLCSGSTSSLSVPIYEKVKKYTWHIDPTNAGTIISQANTATITWSPSFTGNVDISYSITDATGRVLTSEAVQVDILTMPARPAVANGRASVDWNNPESTFTAGTDGDSYQWQIVPATAGTIEADGNSTTIHWAGGNEHSYAGQVQISYRITRAGNNCGFSEFSPARLVDLLPKPPVTSEDDACAGNNTIINTLLYANDPSYQWMISPAHAGSITNQANTATIIWSPSYAGRADVFYSITDSSGRTLTSDVAQVNIHAIPTRPDVANGPASIDWNNPESTFTADPGGDSYQWQIVPATAGTIKADGNSATVHWAGGNEHSYSGQVQVSYRITREGNNCGFSEFSPARLVDLLPKPPVTLEDDACAGNNTVINTLLYANNPSYQWMISPADAGTITSQANTATITWSPSYAGRANVSYSVTDATGRTLASDAVQVNILAIPARPNVANGPTSVEWNNPESIFTASTGGDNYQWQIIPATAGTIEANGNSATIHWAGGNEHSYAGQVQISYRITRESSNCGISEYSPARLIDLLPKPPVTSEDDACAGNYAVINTLLYANNPSYQWMISPADAGTIISQANTATITWLPSFTGKADVFYSVTDATGYTLVSEAVQVDILTIPARPAVADGPTSVEWNNPESTYTADSSGDNYQWKIVPATAGTIEANGNSVTIHWAGGDEHSYTGQVQVSYRITREGNNCGFSEFSTARLVDLLPKPPVTLEDGGACAGNYTVFNTLLYANYPSYQWMISPAHAGTIINQVNTATITWSPSYAGNVDVFYSVTDSSGHTLTSNVTQIDIYAIPIRPVVANGPTSVDWNKPESMFTAGTGGDSYQWQIVPATAGTIEADGNLATVHWAGGNEHSYAGQVQVSYRITKEGNNCGVSEFSPALLIDLLPEPPQTSENNSCAGNYSVFNTQLYANVISYQWNINPANAGTISSRTSAATINWSQNFSGQVSVSYSVTDSVGRICTSPPVQVTVQPLSEVPKIATGPSSVSWSELTSIFAVAASSVTDVQGYKWSLTPVAGTFSGNTSSVSVAWDQYVGAVQVSYQTHNNCGWSASSPALSVVLQPAPPEIVNKEPCSGSTSTITTPAYKNARGYTWSLSPVDAGTITNRANMATITWSPAFSGQANVSYSVTDITGKIHTSLPVQVNVQPLPAVPEIATGPSSVSWNESASIFAVATRAITDAQGYRWSLSPVAGTFSSPGNISPVTVTWDHLYVGTVQLTYKIHNSCGWSASSPALPVVLQPTPPEISDKVPCSGSTSIASAPIYKNAKRYSWSLLPADAGTIINQDSSITITWSPTFSGQASVSYSVTDAANGIHTSSKAQVTVQPLPAAPGIATGPSSVNWDVPASTFAVAASANTDDQGYQWSLNPAGTFSSSGNASQVTVTWDHLYIGAIPITYKVHNHCGWSASSTPLLVVLQPTPPEVSEKEPCSGTSSTASAPKYKNAKGYSWNLLPANAGTISDGSSGNSVSISWDPLFSGGLITVEYTVTDGTERYSASTQVNLQPLPVNLSQVSGNANVAYSESATVYTASNGWGEYRWEISPTGASTAIQVDGNRLSASWNKKYVGKINISYKVQNACGWSPRSSPVLVVTLLPAPPTIDPSEVCNNGETAVSAPIYQNASTYQWHISPSDAGQLIGNGHQAVIRWNNLYTGEAAISYTILTLTGESYLSSQVSTHVKEVLAKPSIASGPDKVYLNHPLTSYHATSTGIQYEWKLTPSQAAEVQNSTRETISILWNPVYYGEAKIEYRIWNDCGWSEMSDPLVVQVYQSDLSEDIPGIFTPNGDGFNDTWDIPAINQYPEAIIRIYNRAKKLMVEFKGARLPWDGRDRNGNILESGYYLYQIELKKGGKVVSGYVTVLH